MQVWSQRILINILLSIAMIILIISGGLAYNQLQRLLLADDWVIHTHQVIETAFQLQSSLIDAESGINFYLLDKNQKILTNVPEVMSNIKNQLQKLKQLTKDNEKQQIRIALYEKLINEKMDLLNQVYSNVISNTIHPDSQSKNIARREQIKEESNELIKEINAEENNLIITRTLQSAHDTQKSNMLVIMSECISLFLFLLSIMLMNYHLRKLKIAQNKQLKTESELLLSKKNLEKSEERFKLATQGSNIGVWDWFPESNKVYFSNHFREMLGYTEEELPNNLDSFNNLVHPDDYRMLWSTVDDHLQNQTPFHAEFRLKTKNDGYHWFQASGDSLRDSNGNATRMSGSFVDINEQKYFEMLQTMQYAVVNILSKAASLDETSLKIIQIICEGLGWDIGCVWITDAQTNMLHNLSYWQSPLITDRTFENISTLSIYKEGQGLTGETWKQGNAIWVPNIKNDKRFTRIKEAKEIGIESALFIPIRVNNKVVGVIELFSCAKDKAEKELLNLMNSIGPQIGLFIQRQWAENELRTSETYKTAILESALDSIITTDEKGIIMSCNPHTTKIFGYLPEELINTNIEILMPVIDNFISSFVGKVGIEYIAIRKNQESFPAEITTSKMYINKKYIYVIIIRDITERKKIEKMKNEFIAVVSHELRTPITSIRGSLGLILGGATGSLSGKADKLLRIANNNCDRLLIIINDILDVEKMEAGKMDFNLKVVYIDDIIAQSVSANKMFADKYGVSINIDGIIPKLQVNVDESRLMQVIANLISNASKFSPRNDVITIRAIEHDGKIRIDVSDNGQGIPDNFRDKIFHRFSQADSSDTRNISGTGLGLNICKMIIEKLNGTMDFNREKKNGTTFYFELPIWNEKTIQYEKPMGADSTPSQNAILICDDDEDFTKYVGAILESRGYKVDLAFNVQSAKEMIDKNSYDALLLDLILPDEDGIAFIRELRNNSKTAKIPIIILSVITETGKTLLNGDAFSVIDWLDKPVDFNKLLNSIANIKKTSSFALPRILNVEDDTDTQIMIKTLLEGRAVVSSAGSLSEAKSILSEQPFDCVILDLILPDGNGVELIPLFADMELPIIVYSSVELDSHYARCVHDILSKSKTSNDKLLLTILKLLKSDEVNAHE